MTPYILEPEDKRMLRAMRISQEDDFTPIERLMVRAATTPSNESRDAGDR